MHARFDERHAFARLKQLAQPNEESDSFLEMKGADKEDDEDENI